ncbi:hypothetical protein [Ancylobacter oerskovii]|uniref:Uncharacterized protein n=1 Tax=Ancylobacter oerskovii TaxID=459519 RepID=A0ABW4Z2D6_9HYPH|nr:hypothetical protein [Ancylobacter oerskovii]MBS7544882.1 hypothetical protein [Ancylobacter oerskovii]
MRSFIIAVATIALAAFPCAWDSNPRDMAPVTALVAPHAGAPVSASR